MSAVLSTTGLEKIAHRLGDPLHRGADADSARNSEPTISTTSRLIGDPIGDAPPEAFVTRDGTSLTEVLSNLTTLLLSLGDVLDHQAKSQPPVARMSLRLDEVAEAVGVSRRVLERERAAGRMPKPDIRIGKNVEVATIDDHLCFWIEGREVRVGPLTPDQAEKLSEDLGYDAIA